MCDQNMIFILVPSAPQDIKAIPASNTKIIVSWLPPINLNGEIVSINPFDTVRFQCLNFICVILNSLCIQIAYTFYMLATDDANKDGVYKKVLAPDVEVHEAQRQVNIYYNRILPFAN